jgi:hypothetical protein
VLFEIRAAIPFPLTAISIANKQKRQNGNLKFIGDEAFQFFRRRAPLQKELCRQLVCASWMPFSKEQAGLADAGGSPYPRRTFHRDAGVEAEGQGAVRRGENRIFLPESNGLPQDQNKNMV